MEVLDKFFEKHSMITNKEAERLGIQRYQLAELVNKGKLERVKNGVYKKLGDINDDFALISFNNENIIFSFHTALFLLDLVDRMPNVYHISVPQGYNIGHIKKQIKNIKVHYVNRDRFNIGVSNAVTLFGNQVKTYNAERCICDIIAKRKDVDKQVFVSAITRYFSSKERNTRKLIKYSKMLGVEMEVRKYMEVL